MGTHTGRKKLSIRQIMELFPNDNLAEQWFIQARWPDEIKCPFCQSNRVRDRKTGKRSWRCSACLKDFSTKTGTPMQSSNLEFRVWAIAIYLLTTSLKGIASTKLASDLGTTQKTAWHLAMRIRETYRNTTRERIAGPVEVDETYIGGKEKNKHRKKQTKEGRGPVGKVAIVGAKSRIHNHVQAQVIDPVSAKTLQRFVASTVKDGAMVYSDQNPGYIGLKYQGYTHESVNHSTKQFVNGQTHTNGIESFWALLKRGYYGTYHFMSHQHISRYVDEFSGRFNSRKANTFNQMSMMVLNMSGKCLSYKKLTGSHSRAICR